VSDICPKHSGRTVTEVPSLVVSPVRTRSVEVVRWPVDTERRAACAEAGVACLLAVRRGEPIPALLADEDWIYDDADERDVANRLERLAAHAPGGGASVAPAPGNPGALAVSVSVPVVPAGLTTVEHRVARRLLTSMGTLVARTELPGDDLDSVIAVLQMAFRDHGLQIQPVADAGYLVHPLEPDGVAELS
jgi:hypothetical protein